MIDIGIFGLLVAVVVLLFGFLVTSDYYQIMQSGVAFAYFLLGNVALYVLALGMMCLSVLAIKNARTRKLELT